MDIDNSGNYENNGFGLFWENSKLNDLTIRALTARAADYATKQEANEKDKLVFGAEPVKLPVINSSLSKLLSKRRSHRTFTDKGVDRKELARILGSLRAVDQEHRGYASAGAIYPVEFFCLINKSRDEGLSRKAIYYDPSEHTITVIGDIPAWNDYKNTVCADSQSEPALVVVSCFFEDNVTRKYGERGGRFILYEVGLAAQNIDLVTTEAGMGGFFSGGHYDERLKSMLGLSQLKSFNVALCYLIGHVRPEKGKSKFRKS